MNLSSAMDLPLKTAASWGFVVDPVAGAELGDFYFAALAWLRWRPPAVFCLEAAGRGSTGAAGGLADTALLSGHSWSAASISTGRDFRCICPKGRVWNREVDMHAPCRKSACFSRNTALSDRDRFWTSHI